MTDKAIIKAEFTDYRPVKTRKVLQLVFEVPAEDQTAVFAALGYPIMGTSSWVAIAKLASGAQAPSTNYRGPNGAATSDEESPSSPARLVTPLQRAGEGQDKPRTPKSRSQMAAIKTRDLAFQEWVGFKRSEIIAQFPNEDPDDCARVHTDSWLKQELEIESKSELDVEGPKAEAWDKLITDFEVRAYAR